jgi:hypothetical protein
MKPLVVLFPALLVWLLGFEIAASMWQVQVDYLLATTNGAQILDLARWVGWLPLAGAFLWLRERWLAQTVQTAKATPVNRR